MQRIRPADPGGRQGRPDSQTAGLCLGGGSAEKIIAVLSANGGASPCHDKSRPEEIQAAFSMSKKEFKRAVGKLYKEGRITLLGSDGIRLIS
nr:hypothetical protein [uncultured Desulfobacter sp.]